MCVGGGGPKRGEGGGGGRSGGRFERMPTTMIKVQSLVCECSTHSAMALPPTAGYNPISSPSLPSPPLPSPPLRYASFEYGLVNGSHERHVEQTIERNRALENALPVSRSVQGTGA